MGPMFKYRDQSYQNVLRTKSVWSYKAAGKKTPEYFFPKEILPLCLQACLRFMQNIKPLESFVLINTAGEEIFAKIF